MTDAAVKLRIVCPRTKRRNRSKVMFGPLHQLMLKTLVSAGANGLTDEELSRRLGVRDTNGRGRRNELCRMGFVTDSGGVRRSLAGKNTTVWKATNEGRKRLQHKGDRK